MILDEIEELVQEMSIEDKLKLLVGKDFWHTHAYKNLLGLCLTDGPHGLRKQANDASKPGLFTSVPATSFPTSSCLACSFDEKLLYEVGKAIAIECRQEGVDMLLGPGVNLKRSPLCGRNFEYYSEDPYLSGHLASGFIQGVQSEGVFACIKHFCCNNQEYGRMVNDSIVDERALYELYLKPFLIALSCAQPKAIMCSYNKLNGQRMSENAYFFQEILRKKYAFDGIIISDWGAVFNRVEALKAGLDLEMPASLSYYDLYDAYLEKNISIEEIDSSVRRILKLYKNKPTNLAHEKSDFHLLAKKAALESMVLLKNDKELLPFKKEEKIGIVGNYNLRIQGAGSSIVNPKRVDNLFDCLTEVQASYKVFSSLSEDIKEMDKILFFLGLSKEKEIEGKDRSDLKLDEHDLNLLEEVLKLNERVVVVLTTGSVVELPMINSIPGLILTYLAGEASISALIDILYGYANPCGHLAETWVKKLEDVPVDHFAKDVYQSIYKESLFIGYRYYDKVNIEPLFPFGYGLSYTEFEISDLIVKENKVFFQVKNIGRMTGKAVIQLYVQDTNPNLLRPVRELKAFLKEEVKPQEQKQLSFNIEDSFFEYYDIKKKDYVVSGGTYILEIGTSSRDICLSTSYIVDAKKCLEPMNGYFKMKSIKDITKGDFEQIYHKDIPKKSPKHPFTLDTSMMDLKEKWIGRAFIYFGLKALKKRSETVEEFEMNQYTFLTGPIRMIGMGLNKTTHQLEGIVDIMNGKYGRGLCRFLKKDKRTFKKSSI